MNAEQETFSDDLERMGETDYVWREWKEKVLDNIIFLKGEELNIG